MDKSLNEAAADKIRKYRGDYNNNPPNAISFMPAIASKASYRSMGTTGDPVPVGQRDVPVNHFTG
jgi:hypothetical protein